MPLRHYEVAVLSILGGYDYFVWLAFEGGLRRALTLEQQPDFLMRSTFLVTLSLIAALAVSAVADAKDDVCISTAREIISAMQAKQDAGRPYTTFRNQLNCDATKLQPAASPEFCALAARHDKWGSSRGVEVRTFAGCRNAQNPPVARCRKLARLIAGIMEERAVGSGAFLTRMGITYDQDCIGIAGHRIINFMVNLQPNLTEATRAQSPLAISDGPNEILRKTTWLNELMPLSCDFQPSIRLIL
jgi:hypothetical protein